MKVVFWVWAIVGLLINSMNWLSLTGNVGTDTFPYIAAAISFLWISGMLWIGFDAVINAINRRSVDAVGQPKPQRPVWVKPEGQWPVAVIYDAAVVERLALGAKDLLYQNDHLSK
jgi:hypothetical protein